MGQARRIGRLIAWVASIGLAAAVSGCVATAGAGSSPNANVVATATSAITPTPPPRPIAAFTCAAGSLPVQPATARTTCTVSTEPSAPLLRATYTGAGSSQPTPDENTLTAAGWKLALRGNSDHAVTNQGYSVYVYQSAWIAFQWGERSDGAIDLTVQSSVPSSNAPIACGQTPSASSAQIKGIVLPEQSFPLSANNWSLLPMAITPVCAADVERFYETALPAAGWHVDTPFVNTSADPSVTHVKHAIFILGNTQATITAAGFPGTPTLIIVTTTAS